MKLRERLNVFRRINAILAILPVNARKRFGLQAFSCLILSVIDLLSIGLIFPLITTLVSDNGSEISLRPIVEGDVDWKVFVAVLISIFVIKNAISTWLSFRQSQYIHNTFVELSNQLYNRFFGQSFENYCQLSTLESVRRIKHVPSEFTNNVLMPLLTLISDVIITISITTFLLIYISDAFVWIIFIAILFYLIYNLLRTKVIAPFNKSFREEVPKSNTILSQGIASFEEAKIYGKEQFFIARFSELNESASRYLADLRSATSMPQRVLETACVISLSAVLGYAQGNDNNSAMILVGLMMVVLYKVAPSMNRTILSLTQINSYYYTIELMKEAFASGSCNEDKRAQTIVFSKEVKLNNICFHYANDTTLTLDNVSLDFQKGDFVVIRGASGIGKSTLLNIITGLLKPQAGQIFVDDQLITGDNIKGWQQKIAYVPQNGVVINDTLLANIAFAETDADVERAMYAIRQTGLTPFLSQFNGGHSYRLSEAGEAISGGQRQRILLARALYRKPEVLILDEVTNQLDHDSKLEILDMLHNLALQQRMTIIFASHDAIVTRYANKTITLKKKANVSDAPVYVDNFS